MKNNILFALCFFLSGFLYAQNNTQLTVNRLKFNEGTIEKAFIDWTGTDIIIENNENGDSDIRLDAENDLFFATDDLTRMLILKNGNVGIGATTLPTYPLQVNFSGFTGFRLLGDNTGDAQLRIENSGGGTHYLFDDISEGNALGIESSGEILFNTNGVNERMRIDADGNVGIGTDSPSEELDVNGDITLNSDATAKTIFFKEIGVTQSLISNSATGLTLRNLNTNVNSGINLESENDIDLEAGDDIRFRTGPSTRMTIHDNGDVGIGTTSIPNGKVEIRYNSSAGDPHLTLSEADASGFSRLTFENFSATNDFWTIAAKVAGGTNNPIFNVFYDDDGNGFGSANYISIDPSSDNFSVRSDVIPSINTFDVGNILDGIDDSEAWDDIVAADFLAPSDRRVKQNIESIETVLPKLLQLNPVTYEYIPELNPDGRHRSGFIAQEVLKVFPNIVVNEDTDIAENGKGLQKKKSKYYTMNYMELIPITIKAIQEQQSQIEDLKQTNEQLQTTNEELMQRLARIEALLGNAPTENRTERVVFTSAELRQNAPNPFTENAQIQFYIPERVKMANLQIMDLNGKVLKSIVLKTRGKGQITLQANLLSAGTYSYSLILDGQVMDTKQMVLTH